MSSNTLRYLKTTALAAVFGVLAFGLALIAAFRVGGIPKALLEGAGALVVLACETVALGGLVVLYRARGLERGQPDLFLRMNADRDLKVVSSGKPGWGIRVRRLLRRLLHQSHPLVGDLV